MGNGHMTPTHCGQTDTHTNITFVTLLAGGNNIVAQALPEIFQTLGTVLLQLCFSLPGRNERFTVPVDSKVQCHDPGM